MKDKLHGRGQDYIDGKRASTAVWIERLVKSFAYC